MIDLPCLECPNDQAEFVTGAVIYPHRRDLADKKAWRCTSCGAYVGCHPGTVDPLGRPAGPKTREARQYVHGLLDPIWREAWREYPAAAKRPHITRLARVRCYEWLADRMGLTAEECHTGLFTIEQCREAYRLLKGVTYSEIRDWAKARRKETT